MHRSMHRRPRVEPLQVHNIARIDTAFIHSMAKAHLCHTLATTAPFHRAGIKLPMKYASCSSYTFVPTTRSRRTWTSLCSTCTHQTNRNTQIGWDSRTGLLYQRIAFGKRKMYAHTGLDAKLLKSNFPRDSKVLKKSAG